MFGCRNHGSFIQGREQSFYEYRISRYPGMGDSTSRSGVNELCDGVVQGLKAGF